MGLSKKDQQALDELNAYLASRTEKTNRTSDQHYIAAQNRTNEQREYQRQACQQRDNTYQSESNSRNLS